LVSYVPEDATGDRWVLGRRDAVQLRYHVPYLEVDMNWLKSKVFRATEAIQEMRRRDITVLCVVYIVLWIVLMCLLVGG
jgi:hypothetical protein